MLSKNKSFLALAGIRIIIAIRTYYGWSRSRFLPKCARSLYKGSDVFACDSQRLLSTCMCSQLVQWLKVCGQGGPSHHAPHIASANVVRRHHKASIQGYSDTSDSCPHLWHKLTTACICCEVPHPNVSMLISYKQHAAVVRQLLCVQQTEQVSHVYSLSLQATLECTNWQ